jgi:hypothetical protein
MLDRPFAARNRQVRWRLKTKSMIHFFRRIRQSLLAQNKISKYLLYAIGEILLVVIGILIALSINNWNTHKLDRISEADYLKRLSLDLAKDTMNYSWTVLSSLDKQKALGNLLAYLKGDQLKTLDSITLITTIASARYLTFAHPKIVSGTFEELKNTGSFRQIQSTLLRSAITDYYSKREHHYLRIENKRVEPSFGDEIDGFIPGFKRTDDEISYRTDLVSYSEIVNTLIKPDFRDIIISEYNLASFIHEVQKEGLEDSKNLLNQIDTEIANTGY